MKQAKFTRVWIATAPSFSSDGGGRWANVVAQTKQYVTVMAPAEYGEFADEKGRLSFTPELGLQVRRLDTNKFFMRQVYAFETPDQHKKMQAMRLVWLAINRRTAGSIPASMTLANLRLAAALLQIPDVLAKEETPSRTKA